MIEAIGIVKSYGDLPVLKDINLSIKESEIVSIVGASGAGKTTLLQILGTLDQPDKGKLTIANQDVTSLNGNKLSKFRNQNIGFVFQFHQLLPEFSALENVCMPAWIGGKKDEESKNRAKELLSMLGLKERMNHKPSALSGGEQQRVAVARSLINNPTVVLADEPSGNLDSKAANDLHDLFFDLRSQFNQTFIIVTHNQALAARSDRQLIIKDGIIEY
jgi:lipoprotein-releasing system ATP-binding protein